MLEINMNPKHNQHTFSPGLTCCVICSSELSFADFIAQQNAEHLTCQSFMCNQIVEDIKKMPKEQADFFLGQQGMMMQAQRQEELDRKAHKTLAQKVVAEENQAILEHIAKSTDDYDLADLHVVSADR